MHADEAATIRAFVSRNRQTRWLEALASPTKRAKFLDRLNHCRDFDDRFATELESNADVVAMLLALGAPPTCRVISDTQELDGREMPVVEAVSAAAESGWGTLICCLPGRLAFFYGERGEHRMVLRR